MKLAIRNRVLTKCSDDQNGEFQSRRDITINKQF